MTKNKKRLVIITAVVILILGIIVLLIVQKPATRTVQSTPTPSPKILEVQLISPKTGDVRMAKTKNAISIFLSSEIDKSTIFIDSLPRNFFTITTLSDFPNRIILTPKSEWEEGRKYTIKILKGVKSKDSQFELKEDINLEYTILPVRKPVYDRPS